jgi:hypothetical protein
MAGCMGPCGYHEVTILGSRHKAQRMIWKMTTGKDPKGLIDYINNDQDDNRWANLRAAAVAENSRNSKHSSTLPTRATQRASCSMPMRKGRRTLLRPDAADLTRVSPDSSAGIRLEAD